MRESGYTAESVGVTAGEMVGMARVDALVVAIGRLTQHPLRAHAPDLAGDVAPQVERRLEPAVGVTEEREVGDADDLRRRGLLDAAELGELGRADAGVAAARFAVGGDAVGHLDPGVGPPGDAPGGAEVDVVGVRDDHQDPLDLVVVHVGSTLVQRPRRASAAEQVSIEGSL